MQTAQLIPVFTGSIHNESTQLVDARTLHRFLEVDAHFKDWIARRIAEYDFQEGEDFCSFLSKSGGGRPRREYSITMDMAKELAMVERNDKGRQARRYFIECEKRLNQIAPDDARTIMGQTIGTDGFHMLGAVLDGKVRQLPVKARQRAKMHVWSQVHKAFSVVSAQDIPANQLDSARNFIAAYTLEGEWLGKEEAKDGVFMKSDDLYLVYFVCHHFNALSKIFNKYGMYKNLEGLGSRAGIEMIGHFDDGGHASYTLLKNYGQQMDDYQRVNGMNQYSRH